MLKDGTILKRLREEKGFTQEEVANRLDVTANTIQNWERTLKFKRVEDLHSLLDAYGVDDAMRNFIIIDVYGRKSENDTVIMENGPDYDALKDAISRLVGEKDTEHYVPYPLDKTCTLLDVVENRIKCLEVTIRYVDTFYFGKTSKLIWGWETALLIDAVGREYSVEIGAAEVYMMQENNRKADAAFPLGDEEGWTIYSTEFQCELDYEDYVDALNAKVGWNRSALPDLKTALGEMKKDLFELSVVRERVLTYICQQGCWESMVDISGLLDVSDEVFWEIVTIKRTGRSYRKVSTLQRMRWFLDPKREHALSIDRRPKMRKKGRMDICSTATYQSKAVVQQALHLMGRALDVMPTEVKLLSMAEWEAVCRQSKVLREHLMQYR